MKLKNKIAIITGGAKGIGKETAMLFAKEGANVIICDCDYLVGQQTLSELKQLSLLCTFYCVDVTNRLQIKNMVDDVVNRYGRIDILINNAGIAGDAMLHQLTEEQRDKAIGINLKGVFNCTQEVVEVMRKQGEGKIVNSTSVVGMYGDIGQINYVAAKACIMWMTKSWAKALGPKGINVNAVAPRFKVSDIKVEVPQKILDFMKQKTSLGRFGHGSNVAHAYLFLASEESDFITGTMLGLDGGLVI